jgi:hypothetical protein
MRRPEGRPNRKRWGKCKGPGVSFIFICFKDLLQIWVLWNVPEAKENPQTHGTEVPLAEAVRRSHWGL